MRMVWRFFMKFIIRIYFSIIILGMIVLFTACGNEKRTI